MKKKFAILLSLVMVLSFTMLSACGGGGDSGEDLSDSKFVGSWKADSMSFADESEGFDHDYMLVVNGDGTGTFSEDEEVSEFTWTPVDGGFKAKGDVNMTFTEDGEELVAKIMGVELHFVRAD